MTSRKSTPVLIAFGANLGSPAEQIKAAWKRVASSPRVRSLGLSGLISTKPVGGPSGQPDFLNAAALLETELSPFELLDFLQSVETEGGRTRYQFWGPRTIDLDILLYGQAVLSTSRLTLPHPRIQWRPFVLRPAAEVAPDMVHPVFKRTMEELLNLMEMNFRLAGVTSCGGMSVRRRNQI